jgi:hypothetical protein
MLLLVLFSMPAQHAPVAALSFKQLAQLAGEPQLLTDGLSIFSGASRLPVTWL